jgi:hypothetical protein
MNAQAYRLFLEGRKAAWNGAGLSDSPYGGMDGDLWRAGVRDVLDDEGERIRDWIAAGLPLDEMPF